MSSRWNDPNSRWFRQEDAYEVNQSERERIHMLSPMYLLPTVVVNYLKLWWAVRHNALYIGICSGQVVALGGFTSQSWIRSLREHLFHLSSTKYDRGYLCWVRAEQILNINPGPKYDAPRFFWLSLWSRKELPTYLLDPTAFPCTQPNPWQHVSI